MPVPNEISGDTATVITDQEGRAVVLPTRFVERARERAALRFFNDPGLPEDIQNELTAGWCALQERIRSRAEAGAPMPPGGCVLLGEGSVFAQALADMHNALAEILGVPTAAVKIKVLDGKRVSADVELPEDWPTGTAHEHEFKRMDAGFKAFVQLYLDDLTRRLNDQFWADVRERMAAVYSGRLELIP